MPTSSISARGKIFLKMFINSLAVSAWMSTSAVLSLLARCRAMARHPPWCKTWLRRDDAPLVKFLAERRARDSGRILVFVPLL